MLNFISNHLSIQCSNMNQITFSLISDLVIAKQSRFILVDRDKDLAIFIKSSFKDMNLTTEKNIEKISFLDLLTLWEDLYIELNQTMPKLVVGIFFDYKIKGLKFLKKLLELYF